MIVLFISMVYDEQKYSSGIIVYIVVDIKIENFMPLKEVCIGMA